MTSPVPVYRVVADDGIYVTVEFDLPDFGRGVTTMRKSIVDRPSGDEILRLLVAKHLQQQDILRQEP